MMVYNLTESPIVYKGKTILPKKGAEFADLLAVPARDQALEKAKLLAFGALPAWWVNAQPKPMTVSQVAKLQKKPEPAKTELPKTDVPKTEAVLESKLFEDVRVDDKTEMSFKKKK